MAASSSEIDSPLGCFHCFAVGDTQHHQQVQREEGVAGGVVEGALGMPPRNEAAMRASSSSSSVGLPEKAGDAEPTASPGSFSHLVALGSGTLLPQEQEFAAVLREEKPSFSAYAKRLAYETWEVENAGAEAHLTLPGQGATDADPVPTSAGARTGAEEAPTARTPSADRDGMIPQPLLLSGSDFRHEVAPLAASPAVTSSLLGSIGGNSVSSSGSGGTPTQQPPTFTPCSSQAHDLNLSPALGGLICTSPEHRPLASTPVVALEQPIVEMRADEDCGEIKADPEEEEEEEAVDCSMVAGGAGVVLDSPGPAAALESHCAGLAPLKLDVASETSDGERGPLEVGGCVHSPSPICTPTVPPLANELVEASDVQGMQSEQESGVAPTSAAAAAASIPTGPASDEAAVPAERSGSGPAIAVAEVDAPGCLAGSSLNADARPQQAATGPDVGTDDTDGSIAADTEGSISVDLGRLWQAAATAESAAAASARPAVRQAAVQPLDYLPVESQLLPAPVAPDIVSFENPEPAPGMLTPPAGQRRCAPGETQGSSASASASSVCDGSEGGEEPEEEEEEPHFVVEAPSPSHSASGSHAILPEEEASIVTAPSQAKSESPASLNSPHEPAEESGSLQSVVEGDAGHADDDAVAGARSPQLLLQLGQRPSCTPPHSMAAPLSFERLAEGTVCTSGAPTPQSQPEAASETAWEATVVTTREGAVAAAVADMAANKPAQVTQGSQTEVPAFPEPVDDMRSAPRIPLTWAASAPVSQMQQPLQQQQQMQQQCRRQRQPASAPPTAAAAEAAAGAAAFLATAREPWSGPRTHSNRRIACR